MDKHIRSILFRFAFPLWLCLAVIACAPQQAKKPASLVEKGGAVVVWDLEDLSPIPPAMPDLGELLSGAVIDSVQSAGPYTVVEREKLLLALEELSLGTSEIADQDTQLQLGRIVGARWMIFGGYQVVGETMRLDMRRVDVATGQVVGAVKKEVAASDVGRWLEGAREAARELL